MDVPRWCLGAKFRRWMAMSTTLRLGHVRDVPPPPHTHTHTQKERLKLDGPWLSASMCAGYESPSAQYSFSISELTAVQN